MDNNLIQNIDAPESNPLEPALVNTDAATTSKPPKLNTKDPKIILLMVLGLIFVILLIVSIIVTIARKTSKPKKSIVLPNSPTIPVSPTLIESSIPTQFVTQFNNIQKDTQTNEEYLPPSIDTEIGL